MRKIWLIIIVLLINIRINAQPFGHAATGYRVVRLDFNASSGEKGSTCFIYNVDGRLYKSFWSLKNNTRSSINNYEHDSNGLIVSANRNFSDGLSSFENFFYNSGGRKTNEYFYRSDSVSGSASYEYDGDLLKKAVLSKFKGWLNGTIIYSHDKVGNKSKAIIKRSGKQIGQISYEYDGEGNLVKEIWGFGGRYNQTFHYHYKKINSGQLYYSSPFLSVPGHLRIIKEAYTYNGESSGPSLYFYDSKGLLNKKVFIRSDSVSTATFYEYDSNRKLIVSKRKYSNGELAVFRYTYDEHDNLVTREFFRADTLYGFESYMYNSDGDLIKAYWKNFDSWLTGNIEFKSDQFGKVTTGLFKGNNGFDADIAYSYNAEGMLDEIRWDFSFGKYQKYNFEYERINHSE
ncbi:hypothetical protein KAR48_16225 [bacterium]|nr:hypothetical protein [bacterium]